MARAAGITGMDHLGTDGGGARPLTNMTVLELGNWITGPLVGQILVSLGARVIKIEGPDGDPFRKWPGGRPSPRFAAYNRGKESVALDLTTEHGQSVFRRAVGSADVVVVALRPDAVTRLEIGYATVQQLAPDAIYCQISGHGLADTNVALPGFETTVQATSGLLSVLVDPANPVAVGPPILEHLTALYAVQAILAAMLDENASRLVDVSLLGAGLALMNEPLAIWSATGAVAASRSRPAYSQAYTMVCEDGALIAMHLSASPRNWERLLGVAGAPAELSDPERFGSRDLRVANFAAAQDILQRVFRTRPATEWMPELVAAEVPCAVMNGIGQLAADPAVQSLGVLRRTQSGASGGDTFTIVAEPDADPRVELAAPELGQHTAALLGELGFTDADIF